MGRKRMMVVVVVVVVKRKYIQLMQMVKLVKRISWKTQQRKLGSEALSDWCGYERDNNNNNNNNNNKSNAMIVVGVLGAISIVQGNNPSTPPASSSSSNASPPPTICTSRLSNVSVNNPITSIGITSSSSCVCHRYCCFFNLNVSSFPRPFKPPGAICKPLTHRSKDSNFFNPKNVSFSIV